MKNFESIVKEIEYQGGVILPYVFHILCGYRMELTLKVGLKIEYYCSKCKRKMVISLES
jgi:hypothetical protein